MEKGELESAKVEDTIGCKEEDKSKAKFTTSQKCSLALLFLVEFLSYCSMSIMSPFYPKEAALRGLSESTSGFVFSFFALIVFLSSPVFGKIMPKIGVRFTFIAGIIICGVMNVVFAAISFIHEYTLYTAMSFATRGIVAFGASAYLNAGFVLVFELYPNNVGYVRGLLETAVGLGMSAGPALGGLLYSMGGFTLPFYVVGAATLAVTPLTAILIPELHYTTQSIPGKTCSLIGILKLPMVFMVAIVVVVVSITWSFLDPTLEPHLRKFELSPEMVGLLFLLLSATYGLLCPLWGWLVDRIKNYCWMMPIGLLINGISLLFLGPSQILVNIEDSVLLKVVTLSLLGVAVAMALMPTYQGLADGAIEGGYPDNVYMQSIVSGIWSCVYSLGEVIGPIMGGFILEYFSFQMTATVVAVINFSAALFLVLYFSKRKSVTMECSEKKGINDMIDRDGVFGSSIKVISVNGSGCSFAQAKCVTKNNVNGACTFSISK